MTENKKRKLSTNKNSSKTSLKPVDSTIKINKIENAETSVQSKKLKKIKKDKKPAQTPKIFDEEIVKEVLKQAETMEQPKSKKRSTIFSIIFLAINIVLVAFIASALFKSAGDMSFAELLAAQGKRLWWLLAAFGLFVIMIFSDAMVFFVLIKKTTGKFRPWVSFKTTAIGKYYESVTPLAVGGQPSQIYNLAKSGISPGVATSIPIMKMMINNLLNVLVGLVFLLFVVPNINSVSALSDMILVVFKVLAYIGIIFNGGVILFIILVANSKFFGRTMAKWVVRLGYKLRIVKNYRTSYDKLMRQVIEFQNSMTYLKKNKGTMLSMIGLNLLTIFSIASFPFMICMAFSNIEFANFGAAMSFWIESIARYYICFLASSYIPLPGGTGMMEVSFVAMFGSSRFLGSNIVWGFLVWRVMSYYLIIVQGIILIISSTIIKVVPKNKNKRKNKTEVILK